jgi:hypothetical protein
VPRLEDTICFTLVFKMQFEFLTIVVYFITTSWDLLNHILLTSQAIRSEVLLKIFSTINDSLPLTVIVFSLRSKGSSTVLNQLIAGLIIVRAIKSMTVSSLPLRV